MSLHNLYKKFVDVLNFTHNVLMYVFLSIEKKISNELIDIDVVFKSILLSFSNYFLLISHK
jgi:hypothetical protein